MRVSRKTPSRLKIGFLPMYDEIGPSSRYRVFQFLKPLEHHGFRCYLAPAPQRNPAKRLTYLPRLFLLALRCDVLFIQKRTLPVWVLKALWRLNPCLIYDFDDAIYSQPEQKVRLDAILRIARVVIAGNEHLAAYARRYNPYVRVIPTVVDSDYYKPPSGERHPGDQRVILGWIGSDPNASGLELLLPTLEWLYQRYGEKLVLRIVAGQDWCVRCSFPMEFIPWRLKTSLSELKRFDIGLAPLKDDEWNRGKCGLKLIQYMAVGIPGVASPVGVQSRIIEHGKNGYLAQSPEEWQNSLATLIENPWLRVQLGIAARCHVEASYSVQSVLPLLIDTLNLATALNDETVASFE